MRDIKDHPLQDGQCFSSYNPRAKTFEWLEHKDVQDFAQGAWGVGWQAPGSFPQKSDGLGWAQPGWLALAPLLLGLTQIHWDSWASLWLIM